MGAAVSALFSFVSAHFLSLSEDGDPAPGVVMTLLIPFAAYLTAERFELSGILAAVSAGMMMNYASMANAGSVASRVRGNSTWTMIEFVFNGMVFILLGLQFPHILGRALLDAHETSNAQVGLLIGYIAAVAAALYAMRFAWVWLLRWFASRGAAKHGMASAVPGLRMVTVTTVAGVRGAVTLAGVLSLPELLPDGAPLPGRDLAIFIASGVILLSLLVAVGALPVLLRGWRRGK